MPANLDDNLIHSAWTAAAPKWFFDRVRVLVVDDHPDTTEILGILFEMLGHDVRTLQRGREVVRATREFDPDVVLLDLGLPDLSGYEVIRAIRQAGGRRRFIAAATGWQAKEHHDRSRAAGFDHFLVKPIDLAKVRQLLVLSEAA